MWEAETRRNVNCKEKPVKIQKYVVECADKLTIE
jgi:hypothetical protein